MPYPRRSTEHLVDHNAILAQLLHDTVLRELTAAHGRALLPIETVCRVLSALKRAGAIAIVKPHRIELLDRNALEAMSEGLRLLSRTAARSRLMPKTLFRDVFAVSCPH